MREVQEFVCLEVMWVDRQKMSIGARIAVAGADVVVVVDNDVVHLADVVAAAAAVVVAVVGMG
jgi:hypothetical protein